MGKSIIFVPPIESFKDTRDVLKELNGGVSSLVSQLETRVVALENAPVQNQSQGVVSSPVPSPETPFSWSALPTLQNSWIASTTSVWGDPGWVKTPKFLCHKGLLEGGTITDGTLLWTSVYVPVYDLVYNIRTVNTAGTAFNSAQLLIDQAGAVKIYGVVSGTKYLHLRSAIPI